MSAEFHTEGLQYLLEVAFTKEQSVPTNYYVGLCTDASLAEDAALADLTEVSGTSYARQTVAAGATDFTSAAKGVAGDRKVTTKEVTFTAGGTWTGANTVFIATTVNNTGKLIASVPLSETRTLVIGDTLTVSIEIDLVG
jgi:hypothetical protein